jgi:hypothetical protein
MLALLTYGAGLGPLAARCLSIGFALAITWLLNRRITFGPSGRGLAAEGARYGGVGIGSSLFNYAVYEAGGPYTVFAPSTAAFDRLTPGAFETMLKPELLVQLRTLVESHIVEDEVGFTDLAGEETTLTTLAGGDITVDAVDTIRVDDALMVESDLAASNGLIHVIDHILQPAQPAISEDSVEELEPLDQDAGDQDAGTSPGA